MWLSDPSQDASVRMLSWVLRKFEDDFKMLSFICFRSINDEVLMPKSCILRGWNGSFIEQTSWTYGVRREVILKLLWANGRDISNAFIQGNVFMDFDLSTPFYTHFYSLSLRDDQTSFVKSSTHF